MAGTGSGALIDLPGTAPEGLIEKGVEINGLYLGPGTPYIITKWDGFGSPEVRTTDEAREGEDGDFLGVDTLGSRVMTLEVTVRGADATEVDANFRDLLRAWGQDKGVNYSNLWFILPGATEALRAIGRPRRSAADRSKMISGRIDCILEFYSPFAPLYGENASITPSAPVSYLSMGGRTYPMTYPRLYSVTTSGGASTFVDNEGSYPAWATVKFTGGVVTNPKLLVPATGEYIGFGLTLAPADVLLVDMRLRTAKKNGIPVRYTLLAGSTWFSFPAGEVLELKYAPTAADTTATCTVTYAPAHKG